MRLVPSRRGVFAHLLVCLLMGVAAVSVLAPAPVYAQEDNCDDGRDNDNDGRTDCADLDCHLAPCDDGWDCTVNDTCDSDGPLAGRACVGNPSHPRCDNGRYCDGPELCSPGNVNSDADGCRNLGSPCSAGTNCNESTDTCEEETCFDGDDDDGDTLIDCNDPDCADCPNGTRCTNSGRCVESDCANGQDDDGDGKVDCVDNNCDNRSCDKFACVIDEVCDFGSLDCTGGTKVNALCDDGRFCNGDVKCFANINSDINGCNADTTPPCGTDPTKVGCDESSDRCTEVDCTDDVDNDGDETGNPDGTDCNDFDGDCPCPAGTICAANGNCIEAICNDLIDNDGDGKTDCADGNCSDGTPCEDGFTCTTGETCSAGSCTGAVNRDFLCDDGLFCTGTEDCAPNNANSDPTTGCRTLSPPCTDAGEACDDTNDVCIEVACNDGINNDGDAQGKDCRDSDCPCPPGAVCNTNVPQCEEVNCGDGVDNDGDGLTDCLDPNCLGAPCSDPFSCTNDATATCRSNGTCRGATPVDANCDDGLWCTGTERCDPADTRADAVTGCRPGAARCTGNGEGCDETNDVCIETSCRDAMDNDGNQGTDCADPDCPCPPGSTCDTGFAPPHCRETLCNDGLDNDGDTLVDCADLDCVLRPCDDNVNCTTDIGAVCTPPGPPPPPGPPGSPAPPGTTCQGSTPNHAFCDDGDVCNGGERCRPANALSDADGCIGGVNPPCTDPGEACVEVGGQPVCREVECADQTDNDGDGPIDCNDSDCVCPDGTTCRANGGCPEANCSNGLDDDGDGLVDCADPDCNNVPCDDGYSCTVGDKCQRNPNTNVRGCFGTLTDSLCDDNATCTADTCQPQASLADPITGCVNAPVPPNDANNCNDGASCTTDVCDPDNPNAIQGTGCVITPDDSQCNDGLFCTGVEFCDPNSLAAEAGTGCVNGADQCTDSGEVCNDDTDQCQEQACRNGQDDDSDGLTDCGDPDCPPATAEDCSDQIDNDCDGLIDCADTVDCRKDLDGDGHFALPCGGDCDDANPGINPGGTEDCTSPADDDCDGLTNCADTFDCLKDLDGDFQAGRPCGDDCDDSDPNVFLGAVEICNNGKDDDCDGLPDCADPDCASAPCSDGIDCTTGDVCVNGSCRGTANNGACDDNTFCTVDQCVAGLGCVNTPEATRCNDGQFCNGVETCEPASGAADSNGCVDGQDPCASDEVCDEALNRCECPSDVFEPDTACLDAREVVVDQILRSEDHTLCPEGDLDRIEFAVVSGTEYTFFSTGGVDTLGVLTDVNCSVELARNNDCSVGDRNFCLQWTATFTGRAVLTVQSGEGLPAVKEGDAGVGETTLIGDGPRGAMGSVDLSSLLEGGEPEVEQAQGPYTLFYQASQQACVTDSAEPGDSVCATSPEITPTTTPVTEDHTLCPTGDIDGWRFQGQAGVTYRFSSLGGTDTKVQIRTDDCTVVLQTAEECNGDPNFCIEFTPVSTGFYKVAVLGQNQQVTGPYQFRYERLGGGSTCQTDAAEPDDGCSEAVFLSVGPAEQTATRTLCEEGDVDTFRFVAEAGKIYRFQTAGGLDTRVIVGSDNCGQTLADETSCGPDALNACVLWEAPASGAFKVRVRGRLSSVTGPYELRYQQETCPQDGYEPDSNCGQATTLSPDATLRRQAHTICPAEEIDFFEFFGVAGETYRFFSEGPTDMGGAVLNANCGKFLVKDESSGTGGENFDLRFTPRETGMYKLGVTGDGGPYDLFYQRVSDPGTACVEDGAEDDDTCAQGTPIMPSASEQMMVRTLCPTDDRDHFTFQAVAGTTYRFWTEGDVDTLGSVRGPDCSQLKRNDDRDLPDDLNFFIEWTAPASGEAHVRVRGFNRASTVGDYTFHFQIAP